MEVQLHYFLTSALGKSGQFHTPNAISPANRSPKPLESETGWAPEPIWTYWKILKSVAPARNRTMIPRPSSPSPSHYTDYVCGNEYRIHFHFTTIGINFNVLK